MKQYDNVKFAFVLGREQKIALAELDSVLRRFCFDFTPSNISLVGKAAIINITNRSEREVLELINSLGGTTKIFKIVAMRDEKLPDQIARIIVDNLRSKKANFAISNYAREKVSAGLGASIKSKLRNRRISSRYLSPKDGLALSSAESWHGIIKKGGVEIGIFQNNKAEIKDNKHISKIINDNHEAIGILIAVSNPDQWAKKDYGKPRSDAKSGMMPPKLARMLINITCGQAITNNKETRYKQIPNSYNQIQNDQFRSVDKISGGVLPVVFDPFCGSGNILIEALDMGFSVAGSDISEKAVGDTKTNLSWFISQKSKVRSQNCNLKAVNDYPGKLEANSYQLKAVDVLDATSDRFSINDQRPTVVVTEPYLGVPRKNKLTMEEADKEVAKLKPLYLDFLANLYKQKEKINLVSVSIAFPLFELSCGGRTSLFSEVLDEIREIGYIVPCAPYVYGREYQVIKRQIVVLKTQDTRNNNQTISNNQ